MQAPDTTLPRPSSLVVSSSRSSSESSDFTEASDSSGYCSTWFQETSMARASAPKRNPFNRRRDVIKTAAPVTSLHDLNQIPTRLSNLGDGRIHDSWHLPVTCSDKSTGSRSVSPQPSPSSTSLVASKVSWAPNVKDPSTRTRMRRRSHLPRLLPSEYIPSDKDVVIELQDEEDISDSITSLRFEVMVHASLLKYIRASRQERLVIVDRIVSAVSAEQGRFVRYYNGSWVQVDRDTARDFTANEMKFGARDVLRRIQAKRKAMTALLHARQTTFGSKGDSISSNHKLQAKFKVPRRKLMVIPPDVEIRQSFEIGVRQPDNPLELLSKVAMSLQEHA